jgi:hypothetical protein
MLGDRGPQFAHFRAFRLYTQSQGQVLFDDPAVTAVKKEPEAAEPGSETAGGFRRQQVEKPGRSPEDKERGPISQISEKLFHSDPFPHSL